MVRETHSFTTGMSKIKVLLIGIRPEFINYSRFPGITEVSLTRDVKAQERKLKDLGYDTTSCGVDRGDTAESVVTAALREKEYDVVCIGAGVRTSPDYFLLFEKLMNVVHHNAPTAKICFNTSPSDTLEAILRWVKPTGRTRAA